MKILVIGGVAAGTKTAAKLKREDRTLDVVLLTRDRDISYAGCGLPYYVGGLIESSDALVVNTPEKYAALTGVAVHTGREAVELDSAAKTVKAKNLLTGETETYAYDRLVLAVGASPVIPPIEGVELNGVFKMRTPEDAVRIRAYIEAEQVKKAVVIGGSFIGLEAADNLRAQGAEVTVIDLAPQLLPNVLDSEMADYVRRHLQKQGVRVMTGVGAEKLLGEGRNHANFLFLLIFEGIGCGIITILIRYFGGYSEGVTYAILCMNACAVLLDKIGRPVKFGAPKKEAAKK